MNIMNKFKVFKPEDREDVKGRFRNVLRIIDRQIARTERGEMYLSLFDKDELHAYAAITYLEDFIRTLLDDVEKAQLGKVNPASESFHRVIRDSMAAGLLYRKLLTLQKDLILPFIGSDMEA